MGGWLIVYVILAVYSMVLWLPALAERRTDIPSLVGPCWTVWDTIGVTFQALVLGAFWPVVVVVGVIWALFKWSVITWPFRWYHNWLRGFAE